MKAIITKYALSSGIQVLEGEDRGKTFCANPNMGGWHSRFHGSDWHKDKQSAIDRLIAMRIRKHASLQKQIAALDAKFDKAKQAIEAADLT